MITSRYPSKRATATGERILLLTPPPNPLQLPYSSVRGLAMLRIQLLGSFQVSDDEKPIAKLQSDRLQVLLAYLVPHRTQLLSRQQLSVTLWPETTDAQACTNLRTLLARLREALPDADQFLMVVCFTLPTSLTLSVGRKPCIFHVSSN
jgi:hypothetical protein